MINYSAIKKCLFVLLLVILISSSVSALGVSPARKIVKFEPNLEQEVEFSILNSDNENMRVLVYPENTFEGGEIIIDQDDIMISSNEDKKTVKYKFKLPNKFDVPGPHTANIVVMQVPLESNSLQGTVIGASLSVIHQLRVDVSYPGKYGISELRITETGRTDQVDFIVALNNLGTEKIENAKGLVEIYNALSGEKIKTLETELFSVDAEKQGEVGVVWNDNVEFGKYVAKLIVTYDDKTSESERDFTVGKTMLEILYIYAKDFKLGQIAKFNILIENKWPEAVNDVYTEFFISRLGKEVANFKSATESIEGDSKKELTAYWDTDGVEAGEHDAKIVLNHEGEKVELDVKTIIGPNSIVFEGLSGEVVGSGFVNSGFLIGAVVLVIVTSLFWLVFFKLKKKK